MEMTAVHQKSMIHYKAIAKGFAWIMLMWCFRFFLHKHIFHLNSKIENASFYQIMLSFIVSDKDYYRSALSSVMSHWGDLILFLIRGAHRE